MERKGFVSAIFDPEPAQWGLRGDPFLWHYLKECYALVKLPYPPEKFWEDVFRLFIDLTGETPAPGGQYFIEKFAKGHVGMSTGFLSGDFAVRLDGELPCGWNPWGIRRRVGTVQISGFAFQRGEH